MPKKQQKQTIGDYVKFKGLRGGVKMMATISGRARSTLTEWYEKDRRLFDLVLYMCLQVAKKPQGMWLPPGMLIDTGYTGPVVITTMNRKQYVCLLVNGSYFNRNSGDHIPTDTIGRVLAFEEDLELCNSQN